MTVHKRIFDSLTRKAKNFFPGYDPELPGLISMFDSSNYPRIEFDPEKDTATIRIWCQDNFGDNWIWSHETFFFKNQEDATLFALRWV